MSLIEIYNETIQDLLTTDAKPLELRTAGNKVSIPNLKEVVIRNLDDIKKTMAQGDKNRTVASTKMNSTRSVCAKKRIASKFWNLLIYINILIKTLLKNPASKCIV